MLRYMTSGESHGRCILAILDGMPSGLKVDESDINRELSRRMFGYGRSGRMSIESDKAEILSGLRKSMTIGSPVTVMIRNVDHSIDKMPPVFNPRPGHADLAGIMKYGLGDARGILERASARETAARVGIGAFARKLLGEFGIRLTSHVVAIGGVEYTPKNLSFDRVVKLASGSPVRSVDPDISKRMCREIDIALKDGDTLGGIFEVVVNGIPPGLGSHTQWDRRLDANLARAIMSIQAIKGVGFGMGFEAAASAGSKVHDEIFYSKANGYFRKTNNAGGLEGGMTNGEDIIIHAAMKPISTLKRPLASVNIRTKRPASASVERSDVCAVPAAGVVGEAVVAIEIANAMMEKFGGDSVEEMRRNFEGYMIRVKRF